MSSGRSLILSSGTVAGGSLNSDPVRRPANPAPGPAFEGVSLGALGALTAVVLRSGSFLTAKSAFLRRWAERSALRAAAVVTATFSVILLGLRGP